MATRFERLQQEIGDKPSETPAAAPAPSAHAIKKKVLRVEPGTSVAPGHHVQNVTLYHFCKGTKDFWIRGAMPQPKFPDEYLKVAVLHTTPAEAFEISSEKGWEKNPVVKETFPWLWNRENRGTYRASIVGDILVEENGHVWFCDGDQWKYYGQHHA
eukprot:TRINITY_DN1138_c0_g1_i1.p1 TRINITY_DN1138_c0_g1~~TRINITY_DN1138_c0_g1_i1.p1  ORF type:complete len:157 (-),score=40.51 TRINITY_DN1138_c0_g1_i1:57-527(-)